MANSIFEILHIVFKHRFLVLGTFAVIFLSVVIGTMLREDEYRASGRLMMTGQRTYFRLASEGVKPREPELRDINTEIENLRSVDFLAKVLEVLSSEQEAQTTESGALPAATEESPQEGPTLSSLREKLEITAVPNSALVEVVYTDSDPQQAAAVVNTILAHYPRHQASLHQEPAALAFYEKQQAALEEEIRTAEESFQAFQEGSSLFHLNQQRDQSLDRIEQVRGRLRGTYTDLDQGAGKIAAIERQLAQRQKQMVTTRDMVNPEAKLLNERLVQLEVERVSLLQRYTEKDRRVQDLGNEIEVVKQKIVDTANKRVVVEERIGIDPVYQDLIRELSEQKVKQGQQIAKKANLEAQVQRFTEEARKLNARGYEYQRQEEELDRKKELFTMYAKKAEEARIAAAMNREQLVNVKPVDSAQIPTAPLAAGTAMALLLAAIVGAGAGMGGALTLEYLRPTFHSAIDVERQLELPVLALVPDLREQT